MIFLDTDVASLAIKSNGPEMEAVTRWSAQGHEIRICAIVAFELTVWSPARHKTAHRLQQFFRRTVIEPITQDEAFYAGELVLELKKAGTPIGDGEKGNNNDCIIAAQCILKNATLATRNTNHFRRFSGLQLARFN